MAISLSARAEILSRKRKIEPNLILEIDGVDTIYSAVQVLELARYGQNGIVYGQPGLVYGGGVPLDNNEPLISLSGSGSTITQQLLQDKGAASSVSSISIELIDKDQKITQLVSPGVVVDEILGRKARAYVSFSGGNHPEDSVMIHRGIIDSVAPSAASVKINIASPEAQKRQEIFIKQNTKLTAILNSGDTTAYVDSTTGFIASFSPTIELYIKIGDEIIGVGPVLSGQFGGLSRGQFGTVASTHQIGDDVESFYRIQGNAIDLALKIMMSKADAYFATGIDIDSIGARSNSDIDTSVIFFNIPDVQDRYGLVIGDKVTISGSLSNDASDIVITGFGKNDTGSWIDTASTFIVELNSLGAASLKSKYNVLPEGAGMTPEDVDVARHEQIKSQFNSSIPTIDYYSTDTIVVKDFVASELYYPAGLYTLPRKSKASVGITIPPLADQSVPEIDESVIVNPGQIVSNRSTNKNFYNTVVYKFNKSAIDDKFKSGKINYSASSQNRIKNVGTKPITIEASGLRSGAGTDTLIRINSRRLLERYEFASEYLQKVQVLFKDGFKIEVGDVVVFGSEDLKMSDVSSGSREFAPKLYEVVNKSLNIKTGEINLDLLSTNFALDGRYGIVSPSSYTGIGSSASEVVIKDSFSTISPAKEKEKWSDYIGEKIIVYSPDWSNSDTVTLVGFSSFDDYVMQVNPALNFTPSANCIVSVANYPSGPDKTEQSKLKLLHSFFCPHVLVVSSASSTVFDVSPSDIGKFVVGSIVRIHNFNYSVDSPEVTVNDITGNTITVSASLGFAPAAGYEIDLIGFVDNGVPYRLL